MGKKHPVAVNDILLTRFVVLQAAVIGAAVLAAVLTTTLVLVVPAGEEPVVEPRQSAGEPISFTEYITGYFSYKLFNGTWWSNTEVQWKDDQGNLVLWDLTVGEVSILVPAEQLSSLGRATFMGFAPGSDYLELFYSNREGVWRHSFLANYDVFDSTTNTTYRIVPNALQGQNDTKLQYCNWLPSSVPFVFKLIYVYNNDLYIREDLYDPSTEVRITSTGHPTDFYNAIPDWVNKR